MALTVAVHAEARNLPAIQAVQGAQILAPAEDMNVPAVHWVHVETPVVLANVPARHGMHTPLKEAPTVTE